jgi:membrane protein
MNAERRWSSGRLRLVVLVRRCIGQFIANRCLIAASALSYTTIVSLIPLVAIVLAIFSGFPFFSAARDRFITVLLSNFAPDVGDLAVSWFQAVATSAAQTTAIGAGALVVTAILLLLTIEDHLQTIWEIAEPRPWRQRVLAYWMVLTLGPMLIGIGFSLPSYLGGVARNLGADIVVADLGGLRWLGAFDNVVSFVLEMVAFAMLYGLIPNCRVFFRDSAIGAFLAAALMEFLKFLFGIFVSKFSSYGVVYGALAGIPIFLLWMYIFWAVVLLGAELAAALRHSRTKVETDV